LPLVWAVSDISLRLAALEAAIGGAGGDDTFLDEVVGGDSVPLVEAVPAAHVCAPGAGGSAAAHPDPPRPAVVAVAGAAPESAAKPTEQLSSKGAPGDERVGAYKVTSTPEEAVFKIGRASCREKGQVSVGGVP